MVEASHAVIGAYALLILAYASAYMRQRYNKRRALEIKSELETMSFAFTDIQRELTYVNDGLDSVLDKEDPVHDRLAAHSAIDSAERMLDRLEGEGASRLCDVVSHPAALLAAALENDEGDPKDSLIAMGSLTKRLSAMLDSIGIRPDDLSLSSSQFERLGSLFEEHDRHKHARDAYEASLRHGHRLDSMSGLLRIVRAFGTRSELIETLEVHLSTDPDDMAALIEQLSLLPESDSRSSRNRRRLDSLDWDGEMEVEVVGSIRNLRSRAMGPDIVEMSPEVKVKRARHKISSGKLDEGLELLDGLALEDRNSDEVLLLRADAAQQKGQYELALKLIRDSKSVSKDAILMEVSLLVSMGLADQAMTYLNSQVSLHGGAALHEAAMKLAIALGDLNNARRTLGQSSGIEPTLGLLEAEVMVLMEESKLEKDASGLVVEERIDRLRECSSDMKSLDREDHRGWLSSSYWNRLTGELEEALTCVIRARRIAERDPVVLLEEARVRIEIMDFDEARSILRECDKLRADKVDLNFLNGLAFAREGRIEEAEKRFLNVLELDPDHVSSRLNLSMLYLLQDKYDLAIQQSLRVMETRPNNPTAIKHSGKAMIGLSMWDEAIDMLERALCLQKNDVETMAILASCLLRTGRGEQAESLLNEAIRIDSISSEPWACRAKLYIEFSRIEEAISDLEKALECDPKRSDVLMMLAELEERTGDFRAASRRWRQVLDIDPGDQHARSRLRLMKSMAGISTERVHVR